MSIPGRYLAMLLAMTADSITGIAYTLQARGVFPPYARTGRAWGPSLVADLHLGGYVMLAGSDIAMTAVAIGLAVCFIRHGRAAGTGTFRGALARQMAAAGLPAPHGHDNDSSLAAYNAYLQALSGGDRDSCGG